MIISNLSTILGKKKLKIANIIKETNISRPTLTALYYNHGKGINFDTLNILCQYLKITPGELFTFYDFDVKSIEVVFPSVTEDEIIDEQGNVNTIITFADFECTILFEQKHINDLLITGWLSSSDGKSFSANCKLNITREQYINLAPDDVLEYIDTQIIDALIENFPIDELIDIDFVSYSYVNTP